MCATSASWIAKPAPEQKNSVITVRIVAATISSSEGRIGRRMKASTSILRLAAQSARFFEQAVPLQRGARVLLVLLHVEMADDAVERAQLGLGQHVVHDAAVRFARHLEPDAWE